MTRALAPGVALTIYDGRSAATALARAGDLVPLADIVCLHTAPDPSDAGAVRDLRRMHPHARMWFAAPANPLVAMSHDRAVDTARAWARHARDFGAELLEINAEGAGSPGGKGWKPGQGLEADALQRLGHDVLAAIHDEAPALAIGLTSHDFLTGHALPWKALLGPDSPADLHRPQHYPATKDHSVSLRELAGRVDAAIAHTQPLVTRGVVRPEFCPRAASWSPYLQGWGHDVAATCWGLDQAPIGSLWAAPGSWGSNGSIALRADAALRREVGHAPGRVARYQAAHGLTADGVCGPRTLAALGIT